MVIEIVGDWSDGHHLVVQSKYLQVVAHDRINEDDHDEETGDANDNQDWDRDADRWSVKNPSTIESSKETTEIFTEESNKKNTNVYTDESHKENYNLRADDETDRDSKEDEYDGDVEGNYLGLSTVNAEDGERCQENANN